MPAKSPSSRAAKARPCTSKRPPLKPSSPSPASGHGIPSLEHHDLRAVWRAVEDLRPYERNARRHPPKQIEKLAASIGEFGFLIAILIDADGRIIAGHARLEAAKRLGLPRVPTIEVAHLSAAQVRAFRIADNRLTELAQWDEQVLAIELEALSELDLNFDLEITGFELAEIDILIEGDERGGAPDEAEEILELDEDRPLVSRMGDLWLLGEHRLLCADALQPRTMSACWRAKWRRWCSWIHPTTFRSMVKVGGLGKIRHAEFVMASGEMSEDTFTAFLSGALSNLAAHCSDGALLYSCMDWRHAYEIQSAGRQVGLALLNLCVRNKDNGGMGSFYRSKHELVFVFKKGSAPHINNIELGQYGRYRTNVWDYPGMNTLRHGRLEELAMHPTVKPVALVADAIKDCTGRRQIVIDAFAGSGSTIIAAHKSGRRGYAMELDPRYVDVAIRRWQRLTGEQAIHAQNGSAFDEIARDAAAEPSTSRPNTWETGDGA